MPGPMTSERLAAVAAEREACARRCEELVALVAAPGDGGNALQEACNDGTRQALLIAAKAIRERGK